MAPDPLLDRVYRFNRFRLMADERILLRDDERIQMSPRVFELLLVLVENAGRLVTKETLLNRIWADSFVEEGNLNQTVSRLRKLLGERPNENRFIETVPRVGYRFVAEVHVIDRPAETAARTSIPSVGPAATVRTRSSRKWIAVPAGFVLVALGSFFFWYFGDRTSLTVASTPPKHTPIRLTDFPKREERPVFTRDGDIRFTRWEGETPLTFVMGPDGSNQRRETAIAGLRTGSWAPDGKKVVFYKEVDDDRLYLANNDGSNEIALPFIAGNMDWSPDSTSILYQTGRTNSDIYLYTLATGKSTTVVAAPGFESDPSFSPDGRSLLFISDRDGNAEIYAQDLDGANLRRLTNHPAHDEFPTFSPDGTQIVFNSNREEENFDVYIMNADGGGVRRVTNWKSEEEIRPGCWSADGTQILLVSNKEGKGDVYKMDIEPFAPVEVLRDESHDLRSPVYLPDGGKLIYVSVSESKMGELHLLDLATKQDRVLLTSEIADLHPKFSPDGNSILFQNRIEGNAEICVMSVDGGEVRNLTNNPARDINPAWSPDGSQIVFASNREGNYDVFPIYVMNADGSHPHRVYYTYAISSSPAWSPDGRQIVFANDKEDNRSGNFELFSIEPETVNPETRLTFRKRYDTEPVFSPDGKRIAFASNTDGNWEIYVMNQDGSRLLRVTRDPSTDMNPSWSADGKRVIFSGERNGKAAIFETSID